MTVIANLLAGLGGTQAIAISVAAGLAVGVVGAATVGGAFDADGGAGAATLPVYACPDTAPELARIAAGQEMLVTGRTEDGSWVRIHFPVPGRTEAWVEAAPLALDGQLAEVPVAACGAAALVPPTAGPNPSLTAVLDPALRPTDPPVATPTASPSATPAPTKAPTPAPTAVADTAPPKVTTVAIAHPRITGNVNACANVTTATEEVITVTVTDPSGVASVTVVATNTWTGQKATTSAAKQANGTWRVTLRKGDVGLGRITFTVRAADTKGNGTAALSNRAWAFWSQDDCTAPNLDWYQIGEYVSPAPCTTNITLGSYANDPSGVSSVRAIVFDLKTGAELARFVMADEGGTVHEYDLRYVDVPMSESDQYGWRILASDRYGNQVLTDMIGTFLRYPCIT